MAMEFHVNLLDRRELSGEIYRQLRRAILDGRLRPGELLPPTRELARNLSVARTTVTTAYDRLSGEGFVASRVGAGTFVSEHGAPEPGRRRTEGSLQPRAVWNEIPLVTAFARKAPFDFRTGVPDVSLFPHDRWRRLLSSAFRAEALQTGGYGDPAGHRTLRDTIARYIGIARGMEIAGDDVTMVNGAQQGIDVVARCLIAPGETVAVEDPGYPLVRRLLESLGARVRGVPVDHEGLMVDALPRSARLVYVTPSHQYPLGMTMTLARRRALLEWAERHHAAIIEDDYDSEFRFRERPIEPLQTLDTSGRVIYIGSFSKTMLPALRLGFVVTPTAIRSTIHRAKQVTDWHTSIPLQIALEHFIESGEFARHIRKMREVYRVRHEMVTEGLARKFGDVLQLLPSFAGLHVAALARTASAESIRRVARKASEAGVEIQEMSTFAVTQSHRPGIVLGYGAIPTTKIREGLRRLRHSFDSI
jgi:GntR family transcriptional regulator/MocR family aminotransferase